MNSALKRFILSSLLLSCGAVLMAAQRVNVTYLMPGQALSHEDSAAVAWLKKNPHVALTIRNAADVRGGVKPGDVLWVHLSDEASYRRWAEMKEGNAVVAEHYRHGGRILLTGYSTLLLNDLAIEPRTLEVRKDTIQNEWLFDKKGFQSFRGHPLFNGLFGGEYVWDPDEDQILPLVGYFDGSFPEAGRVVAVDKAYVFVHAKRKIVFEYAKGDGKILAVGGAVYFGRRNSLRLNLERFIGNALSYLGGTNTKGPVTYWERFENKPRVFSCSTRPVRAGDLQVDALPSTGMLMTRPNAGSDFYDVGGRRALIMGKESGGIDEFWVHPFRVLRQFQIGIIGSDSVTWLSAYPVDVEVRPESFTRIYHTPGGRIKEIVFSSLDKPGGIVHLSADHAVRLAVRYSADLRWMWPFDANALGDVYYGFDRTLNAHHLRDISGDFYCVAGGDKAPVAHAEGQYARVDWTPSGMRGVPTDENRVSVLLEYQLRPAASGSLNFVIVGTNEGKKAALGTYRDLMGNPSGAYIRQVDNYVELFKRAVAVTTPDSEFNSLYKWAIAGVDRFFAVTPGVGSGLLAGFATTARGWTGEHRNSGRPGYAWYFGRDSEWSGFAIDDYGDFDLVKQQLTFLQAYQDGAGKIFHEISTSGVVHYDAADATPLYVVLAGHYLRASGDVAFLKRSWPHLQRAMEFLYSTDTDGDHLIENTNVGHGWVEGGKLFGVHTELYLAASWQRALTEMAYIASAIGKKDLARNYADDAARVKEIINTDFWNPGTKFYNFGKFKEGTYSTEPTTSPAVAMYFDVLDDTKVDSMLRAYAGNGFTADWGVRILSTSSPLFNPAGYHYGSIWPLFTGWTALGEYAYGDPTAAFTHVADNMLIKNHWALGYVEEVMNGAIYRPTGVCPHQCWSETNILHPILNGMVGWRPDAPSSEALLQPRFPLHWDTVTVTHLRVGRSRVSLTMERTNWATDYLLRLEEGPAVTIDLAPQAPLGSEITGIRVDGRKVGVPTSLKRGVLDPPVRVRLSGKNRVTISHSGGLGLCPVVLRPAPGDSSQGYRIISEAVKDGQYIAVLEGKSGTTYSFKLRMFGGRATAVSGATVNETADTRFVELTVPFEQSPGRFVGKTVVLRLE